MSSLTNCMYTAQGELVCVPNKNKTSQESQLIEKFVAVKKQQPKPPTAATTTPSKNCTKKEDCPAAMYDTCDTESGWCVPKSESTS